MNLQEREKRLLILLAIIAPLILVWYLLTDTDEPVQVVTAVTDIPSAEKRLARLRQVAATVPGKEQILTQTRNQLADREKGLIPADTAAQAQAQLLQVLRQIARKQSPPIDLRNTEMGPVKAFGDSYGEVAVSANFECGIEQLLQLLSDLTAQKEAIGTTELRVGAANARDKTMPVRLTVSGLVRKQLVAEKKGSGSL